MNKNMKWWGWGDERKESDISNMPFFWPFAEKNLGISEKHTREKIKFENIILPPLKTNIPFQKDMESLLRSDQIFSDKLERLCHTYGKSYRDLLRIRQGIINRAPDLVIYPESHEQVEAIVKAALQHSVCLIPFGGGTNIVGAIEALSAEARIVVSLDMKRMNKVLTIDSTSGTARIEAGALGPEIEKQLNAKGFSLGHYPDSFEFSTLGGWIATRSAGMQSDQYGTIADMVLAIQVVTPQGNLTTKVIPKAATGPDINQLVIGSEGTLGIITEATMKIRRLNKRQEFRGILFPDFATGVAALHACVTEDCLPHTMRLHDNRETQLMFSFKHKSNPLKSQIDKLAKKYLQKIKKFDLSKSCILILAFSGNEKAVKSKCKKALTLFKKFHAFDLGKKPGQQWFARKYDYPYLRDFMMDHGCMGDVIETSTVWANILNVYDSVKHAIYLAFKSTSPTDVVDSLLANNMPPGYIGCHISHSYLNGACLYFTFASVQKSGEELSQYLSVKKAATDAVLKSGGALSHHHSLGYEHSPWLTQEISSVGVQMLQALKNKLDPKEILNPHKIIPTKEMITEWHP